MSKQSVPLIRIFLSSPGDVADERAIARTVIEQLRYDPAFHGKVSFEVVAWEQEGAEMFMPATLPPQEAINQGLPRPSECDLVVVLLWTRLGTPLPHPEYQKPDGSPYLSGTEYEYLDALEAAQATGTPLVVVYQRTEKVLLDPDDPEIEDKLQQQRRVKAFFEGFRSPDGALRQSYQQYAKPEEFRVHFERALRRFVRDFLAQPASVTPQTESKAGAPPLWPGSPFPGLRAFMPDDAPIFFGRGRETDDLVRHFSDPNHRFLAVVGASGSGKSSLVGAGLIPRLLQNALPGSKDWRWLCFTPDELGTGDPFAALAAALREHGALDRALVARLHDDPSVLDELCRALLDGGPDWAEALIFIDQFEELFTAVHPDHQAAFVELLTHATRAKRLRVIVTLRADFFARCVEWPELNALINQNTYSLSRPGTGALHEMIVRPAARAGLAFEDAALPQRLLDDTGGEPGALALLAYTLDELYKAARRGGQPDAHPRRL